MFATILENQKLPGYANKITVEVSVQSILITEGNLKAQWSIILPQFGPLLPGMASPSPLFSGEFDMPPPPAIVQALGGFFKASAPGLVAGLSVKAEAAAKLVVNQAAAAAQAELDRLAAIEAAA
jgi:hypothetical protein